MGSERSNDMSQKAVRGHGEGGTGAGPEEFPRNEEFREGGTYGDPWGDKKPRSQDSEGGSLVMGLSCQYSFGTGNDPDREEKACDELGEGRDESTGKPTGPQKGKVDNHGASSKLQWG